MGNNKNRDIEKSYTPKQMADKLRRLANSIESGERFRISIKGEQINVPVRAKHNIEHEREDGKHEIEFQVKWEDK